MHVHGVKHIATSFYRFLPVCCAFEDGGDYQRKRMFSDDGLDVERATLRQRPTPIAAPVDWIHWQMIRSCDVASIIYIEKRLDRSYFDGIFADLFSEN